MASTSKIAMTKHKTGMKNPFRLTSQHRGLEFINLEWWQFVFGCQAPGFKGVSTWQKGTRANVNEWRANQFEGKTNYIWDLISLKNPSHFWRFLISKKVSFDDRSFAYTALHCQIGSITFDEQNVWRQKAKSSNEKTTQNNYLFFLWGQKVLSPK